MVFRRLFSLIKRDVSSDFTFIKDKIEEKQLFSFLSSKIEFSPFFSKIKARSQSIFDGYCSLLKTKMPLTTGCLTIGVTYSLGEYIAEKIKGDEISLKRILTFGVYGVFLGGPMYHYWFKGLDSIPGEILIKSKGFQTNISNFISSFKDKIIVTKGGNSFFPDSIRLNFIVNSSFNKWTTKAIKICCDQIIFSSLYTLFFLTAIPLMTGEKVKYDKFAEIYIMDWKVWPLLQLVNFTFVPVYLQPIYVNMVNIAWNAYLSHTIGGH